MRKCIFLVCLLMLTATAVSAGRQMPLKADVIVVAQNDEGMGGERPAVRDHSGTDSVPMTTIPSDDSRSRAPSPKPGSSRSWTDSATGMRFVWIPGGCFMMGQTSQEKKWLLNDAGRKKYKQFYADESPRHEACVDGFWIGAFEVTRGQFARFINATNYRTDAERQGKAWVKDSSTDWKWKEVRGRYWRNIGYDQNDNHPAVAISYNDAKAFIAWLERSVGGRFRLPTEAEWEYAARAGTTSKWYWGEDPSQGCRYANVAGQQHWTNHFPCSDPYRFTSPVGAFEPNGYGLYDMLGNVWEWCEDYYNSRAYDKHGRKNPLHLSGSQYVNRGGSWLSWPRTVRSADRISRKPNQPRSSVGFRVVRVR